MFRANEKGSETYESHFHSFFTILATILYIGRNSAVGTATVCGRSGDRKSLGARVTAPSQNCPVARTASCTVDAGPLSWA